MPHLITITLRGVLTSEMHGLRFLIVQCKSSTLTLIPEFQIQRMVCFEGPVDLIYAIVIIKDASFVV